jgi:ankyrin repeat protein
MKTSLKPEIQEYDSIIEQLQQAQESNAITKELANSFIDGEKGKPLHEAAFNNNIELTQLLLKHGADTNAQTDKGSHCSASNSFVWT